MRANPEGDEFVYLKQAWPDALPLNPFDLQVTPGCQCAPSDLGAAGCLTTVTSSCCSLALALKNCSCM